MTVNFPDDNHNLSFKVLGGEVEQVKDSKLNTYRVTVQIGGDNANIVTDLVVTAKTQELALEILEHFSKSIVERGHTTETFEEFKAKNEHFIFRPYIQEEKDTKTDEDYHDGYIYTAHTLPDHSKRFSYTRLDSVALQNIKLYNESLQLKKISIPGSVEFRLFEDKDTPKNAHLGIKPEQQHREDGNISVNDNPDLKDQNLDGFGELFLQEDQSFDKPLIPEGSKQSSINFQSLTAVNLGKLE